MSTSLVYLRDSKTLVAEPDAVRLLEAAGLSPVVAVPPDRADDVCAMIAGLAPLGVNDVAAFRNLKTVARFGTGTDNVDVDGLAARGIAVTRTADLASGDVGELALALIILALRRAPRDMRSLAADAAAWRPIPRGLALSESVIGIAGTGAIGAAVARMALPLARRVLVWNRSGILPEHAAWMAECELCPTLHELALRSNVLSIHLALNAQTSGMIGTSFFAGLAAANHSLALVNTARGGIVDEVALLAALEAGIVHSAAIDVWSAEGAAMNEAVRRLRAHSAVLPSSHLGAYTLGAQRRYAMQCAQNIIAVLAGDLVSIAGNLASPAHIIGAKSAG